MSSTSGFERGSFGTSAGTVEAVDVGEGAVVLLVHGEDADPSYWRDYVPALAQAFRVVVPSLPSAVPPSRRTELVVALLDALGAGRLALVGHGSGGATALAVAAARADVAALVLLDAIEGPGGPGHLASLGARGDLHVFCVWGEDDERSPVAVAERIADSLPMSALATIPGSGHDLPRDEPETLAPLLFEWLRFRFLGRSHRHEADGPVLVTLGRRPTFAEEGLDDPADDAPGDPGGGAEGSG